MIMHFKYQNTYPQAIKQSKHSSLVKVGKAVKAVTKKTEVIIIYGHDWDSSIPYYAERKAIMDRAYRSLEEKEIKKSFSRLEKQNVGAALFCKYDSSAEYNDEFIQHRIEYFNLNSQPIRVGRCDIYYRNTN